MSIFKHLDSHASVQIAVREKVGFIDFPEARSEFLLRDEVLLGHIETIGALYSDCRQAAVI